MTAKIEFRTTQDRVRLSQLILDINYALGLSEFNKGVVEISQKDAEVFDLVLNFPLTIEQERVVKTMLNSGKYEVYWSELYN